jgi:hypothetical protein
VLRGIDLILAEKKVLEASGPEFKIIHRRFSMEGAVYCLPGEQILAVIWVFRGREIPVRLSPTSLLLFDILARCRLPLTATQIEKTAGSEPFYLKQVNAKAQNQLRLIKTRSVKVFVQRIRRQLQKTFSAAGARIDPQRILISSLSDSNVVTYSLRAQVTWHHIRFRNLLP